MMLTSTAALGRLPASSRSLQCRSLHRLASPPGTKHPRPTPATAVAKPTPVAASAGAAARQPGPAKRPGIPSWAEYRVGASSSPEAPLAVLCGWLGCRQAYLRKYSSVYNALGVDTLAVSPPVPYTIFPTLADRATEDLLRMTQGLLLESPPNRPVVLHCFSTGGWLLLGQVLRRAQALAQLGGESAQTQEQQLAAAAASIVGSSRALVVDCAPGPLDSETAARALDAIARNASATESSSAVSAAARRVFEPVMRWHLRRSSVQKRIAETREAWADGGPTCPTLFLYSETDILVPPEDVRAFAASRARIDGRVVLRSFADAPHVELLRRYPEEYADALGAFLGEQGVLLPRGSEPGR